MAWYQDEKGCIHSVSTILKDIPLAQANKLDLEGIGFNDGRIYLLCRKCNKRIALYRWFTHDVRSRWDSNGDCSGLGAFLEKHAGCKPEGEEGWPMPFPDLELVVD